MTTRPEIVAKAHAFAERRLSREELEDWVTAPWTPEDLAEARELIAWHIRRYPTPAARLRHAREAYARWTRSTPPAPRTEPAADGAVSLELE